MGLDYTWHGGGDSVGVLENSETHLKLKSHTISLETMWRTKTGVVDKRYFTRFDFSCVWKNIILYCKSPNVIETKQLDLHIKDQVGKNFNSLSQWLRNQTVET